jgi:hypothetical protein
MKKRDSSKLPAFVAEGFPEALGCFQKPEMMVVLWLSFIAYFKIGCAAAGVFRIGELVNNRHRNGG